MDAKIRARVIVEGRVQGVSFRYATVDAARTCGVCGWVKNRADGSVEAVFEGSKEDVEQIVDWCGRGPRLARVKNVKTQWQPFTGEFERFDIRF